MESTDLIVPHQANKPMVTHLAAKAGIPEDSLYFNIETMGKVSSASIPIAIHDAGRDCVIKVPTRIFVPGFGAGSTMDSDVHVVIQNDAQHTGTRRGCAALAEHGLGRSVGDPPLGHHRTGC